jgi:hypothetical protein
VSTEHAADTMYAIASETTYLRMTEGVAATADPYARWLADTLTATLLTPRGEGLTPTYTTRYGAHGG